MPTLKSQSFCPFRAHHVFHEGERQFTMRRAAQQPDGIDPDARAARRVEVMQPFLTRVEGLGVLSAWKRP